MPTITIKCPHCGAVLSVADSPENAGKSLKCPVCEQRAPYTNYKQVIISGGSTILPGNSNGESTQYATDDSKTSATVTIAATGQTFTLHDGVNTIGRIATTNSAEFMISDPSRVHISRRHINIELRNTAAGAIYVLSLCNARFNTTLINGKPLAYGDTIILQDGDVITLPDNIECIIHNS